MNRYSVKYCDEGGTLTDSEGNNIDHTWDVVDRSKDDGYGHPATVSNHNTRKLARRECRKLNAAWREEQRAAEQLASDALADLANQVGARLKASPLDPNAGTFGVSPASTQSDEALRLAPQPEKDTP